MQRYALTPCSSRAGGSTRSLPGGGTRPPSAAVARSSAGCRMSGCAGAALTILGQPPLTQFLGPWIKPGGGTAYERLEYEHDVMRELIAALPRHDVFLQECHHSMTNCLRVLLAAVLRSRSVIPTCIDDLSDHDQLWAELQHHSPHAYPQGATAGDRARHRRYRDPDRAEQDDLSATGHGGALFGRSDPPPRCSLQRTRSAPHLLRRGRRRQSACRSLSRLGRR